MADPGVVGGFICLASDSVGVGGGGPCPSGVFPNGWAESTCMGSTPSEEVGGIGVPGCEVERRKGGGG